MTNKILSRADFKSAVFKRDNYKCVVCKSPAVDAHHILERKLFEDGGYYLNNGASLCENHHLEAEQTLISVEEIRQLCQITSPILPKDLSNHLIYDKWGNEIKDKNIIPGSLFCDEGCQSMLKMANKIPKDF